MKKVASEQIYAEATRKLIAMLWSRRSRLMLKQRVS